MAVDERLGLSETDVPAWVREEKWTSPGGATFYFERPSAWKLRHASEDLRVETARIVGAGVDLSQSNIIAAVLGARKEFVEKLRDDLFAFVQFESKRAKSPQMLKGAEDMAFADDEPAAIYEVLGRAVARFFWGSVSGMLSRIAGAAEPTTGE